MNSRPYSPIQWILFGVVLLPSFYVFGQNTGVLYGLVVDKTNHDPLPHAVIRIAPLDTAVAADSNGAFRLHLPVGLYTVEASYLGYQSLVVHDVEVDNALPYELLLELLPKEHTLETVEVVADAYRRTAQTPLATHRMSALEIRSTPGAVMDISRMLKTQPGVVPVVSFGYFQIVRGGAAFENSFWVEDIKIPTLTHFTVQGASGGPQGAINALIMKGARLISGAFPVEYANALSSITHIQLRKGRKDRLGGSVFVGATDWGVTAEGPATDRSSFLLSLRQSFAQYALKAIGVPVLPTYYDAQYHHHFQLDPYNEVQIIATATYDRYRLGIYDDTSATYLYNIGYIPEGKQASYAVGIIYRHYLPKSSYTVSLSRNYFLNTAVKYRYNLVEPSNLLLDFHSREGENHFRFTYKAFPDNVEWGLGTQIYQQGLFTDNFRLFARSAQHIDTIDYNTQLGIWHYGLYGYYTYRFGEKLHLTLGLRMQGNTYSDKTRNPLEHISPKIALSLPLSSIWTLNATAGVYTQMPPPIMMGYRAKGSADFTNRGRLDYIRSPQAGLALEHHSARGYRVRIEGFYKAYRNYPVLLRDGISYANATADYVAIGDQEAESSGEGRAYGLEFEAKQKQRRNLFWSVNFSYVRSLFTNADGRLVPSSWDHRYFCHIVAGWQASSGWRYAMRWFYVGGAPYTPYDTLLSSYKTVWNVHFRGIPDYRRVNSRRLPAYHQLDVRIDRRWNFRKWSVSFYFDIQNVYRKAPPLIPYLTVRRDASGNPLPHPTDPKRYRIYIIDDFTSRPLPSIGLIISF